MSDSLSPPRTPEAAPTPGPAAEIAAPGRVLAAVCLACASLPLVFTGPAVALGPLADALHAPAGALAWVTNAFMLSFGATLLPAGALADRLGSARVWRWGAWLFLLASALLPWVGQILAFNLLRALQGLAGAALLAGGAAQLAQAHADAGARTRAFSWLGTSFGAGLVLGPLLTGALTASLGWRALFVPALLSLGTALALNRPAPEARAAAPGPRPRPPFDRAGALLFSGALALFTTAVLRAARQGWTEPGVVTGLLGAVALATWFARVERRAPAPLLDLSLLRLRRFLGIQLLAAAPAYAFVVLLVLLPLRFAGIEEASPGLTGACMAALSGPLLLLPLAAVRATRWCAPATLCSGGLLLAALGLWWLSHAATASAALPAMALIGVGISAPWGLMDGLAVSMVPPERAGMAAGLFNTVRVAGEGVALAVVGSALALRIQAELPSLVPGLASDWPAIAQQLAAGRLGEVLQQHPGLPVTALTQAYQTAFATVLRGLAMVTLLTALLLAAWLRPGPAAAPGAVAAGL